MDSSKNSIPMGNSVQLDGDHERSYKSSTRLSDRETTGIMSPSTSNQTSNIPLNGPRSRHMNSVGIEKASQSSRQSENSSESNKSQSNTSLTQTCSNRVANSKVDQPVAEVAGSSRSVPNVCDYSVESNQDMQSCQRHKVCIDMASSNSSNNQPSTSGSSRPVDNPESSAFRENRKRPSSLKLNRPNLDEDSSSDTGNDDYSLGSEDGCIYTYRGGEHLADLPSSFFSLDMGLPLDRHLPLPNYPVPQQGAREQGSRASSPDMDFLEMDFDPGPSCEVDTGDESTPDAELEAVSNMPEESEPVLRPISPVPAPVPVIAPVPRCNTVTVPVCAPSGSQSQGDDLYSYSMPSTSRSVVTSHGDTAESISQASQTFGLYIVHTNSRGEQLLVRRTMAGSAAAPVSFHVSNGDLVSLREILHSEEEPLEAPFAYQINQGASVDSSNLSSAYYHITMAKKLIAEKNKSEAEAQSAAKSEGASCSGASWVEPPRAMIWSECEACERQVTQIATSACGATAVVNVFVALGVPVNIDRITSAVATRQRANNAPLPRYLLSRAVAGCTAADLVTGIHKASDGLVTARFFPTYPERAMSLSYWLTDWISLGAVPILTLNLQAGCEYNHQSTTPSIPDAWHHQMVFGVSPRGIYLCNPVERVREGALWPQLTSPSVLLVRTSDVLSRFTPNTDLTPLMVVPDRRFHTFNVLGQVANVIRESRAICWGGFGIRTRHIRIPASYQAGITIAALTGSEAHRRLMVAPQLPILTQTDP